MSVHHILVVLLFSFFLSVATLPTYLPGNIPTPLPSNVPLSSPAAIGNRAIPLSRRFNTTDDGRAHILKFDQARARSLRERGRSVSDPDHTSTSVPSLFEVPSGNQAVCYTTPVDMGVPPQTYELLIDTGSSNTFIIQDPDLVDGFPTGDFVSVTYGSGWFFGEEFIGTLTLAGNLTIPDQSFAVADVENGFQGVDGILGMGPQGLTRGSLYLNPTETVPTVMDNAWLEGYITEYTVGISFIPYDASTPTNGELTFGGVDRTKYIGEINYVPITTTSPASEFVGIDQRITYGDEDDEVIIMDTDAGILDTGTTLILLPPKAFQQYQNVTGGVPDQDVGLLRITREQYKNLKSLYFIIGGEKYELCPNAQIWPRALNTLLGGSEDAIYLIVNDFGDAAGEGLVFINGMGFLERFYMVYDIGKNAAGLAKTEHTYLEAN